MSVWDDLVGQEPTVAALTAAVGSPATMTHAWLFTGPPGSGRSVAARAFAAALQCPDSGCGRCEVCHTSLAGTHADVEVVKTAKLTISIDELRSLVVHAAQAPMVGSWRIILIEDADRIQERTWNVLLKALEEPSPRTVWLLCAPSPGELLPTVRSRCRHVPLRTPLTAAVVDVLVRRDKVNPELAWAAARASQGHIGRARRLALDEQAQQRRNDVMQLPMNLDRLSSAMTAAADLVKAATEDATEEAGRVAASETEDMRRALGVGTGSRQPANAGSMLKTLEEEQRKRATRAKRDGIDRALIDLAGFYRDVLAVQTRADVKLVNEEMREAITSVANKSGPETTVRRIDIVLRAREQIGLNVAPLLAVEAMAVALRSP